MDVLKEQHRAYVEALRAHADLLIKQVREQAQASLQKDATRHAVDAYGDVIKNLAWIPEKITNQIRDAHEKYNKNDPTELKFLNRILTGIKNTWLKAYINWATVKRSVIEMAWRNGVDVSEMLKMIDEYAEKIRVESEELFPTE